MPAVDRWNARWMSGASTPKAVWSSCSTVRNPNRMTNGYSASPAVTSEKYWRGLRGFFGFIGPKSTPNIFMRATSRLDPHGFGLGHVDRRVRVDDGFLHDAGVGQQRGHADTAPARD